jgi:hypothetical protein
MVYVYAITESVGRPAADQRGLEDRPLAVEVAGSIAAVYSVHDGPAPRPTADHLWRHEQVIEHLMTDRTVLPARFGTTFGDDGKLAAMLATHHDRLLVGLQRVRGHVELGLRVLWKTPEARDDDPAEPSEPTGHAYMKVRLAEEQRRRAELGRAESLADELDGPLAGLSSERTRRVLARPEVPLTAAYLVPRANLDAFRREVQRLGTARPDVRLLCTGPWPPYHFVPSLVDPAEENRA